jgi:hypothetical protein
MRDSQRYRSNAADCLLAAQDECQPHGRKLRISMAVSWLSLARRDELASWDTSEADCGHQAAAV